MRIIALLFLVALATACSHPIEIVGEGNVLSATGTRDCYLVEAQAELTNCTENLIAGEYLETYTGVPLPGWEFHRWANYCTSAPGEPCSFDVPANTVEQAWGETAPPLVAIFREIVNTGLDSLFIGHSFFVPFARAMPFHAAEAGFSSHSQSVVFSGGGSGAPQALWENASKRAEIQGILDEGDTQLFGMTYHFDYLTLEGYRNWVDYALVQNPDTRFFVAMPWIPFPASFTAGEYDSLWDTVHPAIVHSIIDDLRAEYPGVDFFCIPYGGSAVELRNLYAAGNLPDVQTLVSNSQDSIFLDTLGHGDDILIALGELIWLRAIYDVDISSYSYDPGYQADLKGIADAIMDAHDSAYDAPYHG
jgi:hypothetical protein